MGFVYEFIPSNNIYGNGKTLGVFKGFTAKYPGSPVSLLFEVPGQVRHGEKILKVKCNGYFGHGGFIEKVLRIMGWQPTPEEPLFTYHAFDRFVTESLERKYWLALTRDDLGYQVIDYTTLEPLYLPYELISDVWYDNGQHWCLYSDGDVRIIYSNCDLEGSTSESIIREEKTRYSDIPLDRLLELLNLVQVDAFDRFVKRFNTFFTPRQNLLPPGMLLR